MKILIAAILLASLSINAQSSKDTKLEDLKKIVYHAEKALSYKAVLKEQLSFWKSNKDQVISETKDYLKDKSKETAKEIAKKIKPIGKEAIKKIKEIDLDSAKLTVNAKVKELVK